MKAATCFDGKALFYYDISIHAAREGGDFGQNAPMKEFVISIHAAREGGDPVASSMSIISPLFQSTPPVKAATYTSFVAKMGDRFQSTPPVKAATFNSAEFWAYMDISIHAAREGGDAFRLDSIAFGQYFNPRRP